MVNWKVQDIFVYWYQSDEFQQRYIARPTKHGGKSPQHLRLLQSVMTRHSTY